MFDLTQNALASYLLRAVRDTVARNPRFRATLGDVAVATSNQISYGDVQVIVKDVSSDGNRLSFDYFLCNYFGRAILTKVAGKQGAFVEWVSEIDATLATPAAGVYYFNVDSVDERTRDVGLTIETYKWYAGAVENASGVKIAYRAGIDGTTAVPYDPSDPSSPVAYQGHAGYGYLLGYVSQLAVRGPSGADLAPNADYWIEAVQSSTLIESTVFGVQTATIPAQYESATLTDQNGYTLVPGSDYQYLSSPPAAAATVVQLAPFTPTGYTITVSGPVKLDPTLPQNLVGGENVLDFSLLPGESLAPGQVFVSTQDADGLQLTVRPDGTVVLPSPLPPGGWAKYEARVLVGQSKACAKKLAENRALIPGLSIAIGDQVAVGDQCALVVSPANTQTYEVYGSKEGVRFTLDVRANDPATASELAEALRRELLIARRDLTEADGLTLFEAARSSSSQGRDQTGVSPTWISSLAFSGAADWRVYVPTVTRVANFLVTTVPTTNVWRPIPASRYQALATFGFLPDYK